MDKKGQIKRTIFPKNDYKTVASFDEQSNVLNLKYVGATQQVSLDFSCMEQEKSVPEISYIANTESKKVNDKETFIFKVRTRHVCMHPSTSCEVEDPITGVAYDLSQLMASKEDWIAHDTRPSESNRRYHLSVCKPLSPSSTRYELTNSRTAIFQTNENTPDSVSLGIVGSGLLIHPKDENSLTIHYNDGSQCNAKTNYSSSIIFRCGVTEMGPKFVEQNEDCHFLFEWLSPVACPKKKITTKNECIIKDPITGTTFDLKHLYNETADYKINSKDGDFKINICNNGLHSKCEPETKKMISVCKETSNGNEAKSLGFTKNGKLHYNDGVLMMKYEGSSCDTSSNHSAMILFMCDHQRETGKPEFFSATPNKCDYIFTWKTSLACSPVESECIVFDKDNNFYDLTSLSLSAQNYEIRPDSKTRYSLNVCRSHVSGSIETGCPNKAAVCFGTLQEGSSDGNNWKYFDAGQVGHPEVKS